MYISSLHYNKEGWKKLQYVYISTLLSQGRMKKSCGMCISSLYYNKEGWRKLAVCIYHHFIITRKHEEKLRYVYIMTLLSQGRKKKSRCMYISSLYYSKQGLRKVTVCIYHHFIITRKDKKKFRYVYIITSL